MRLRVCPHFVILTINELRKPKVYIPERGDVHPVATAPIPVATGPVLGSAKRLSVSREAIAARPDV